MAIRYRFPPMKNPPSNGAESRAGFAGKKLRMVVFGSKESCKIPSVICIFLNSTYCFQYIPFFPGLTMKKPGFFIFVFKQKVGIGWYWML